MRGQKWKAFVLDLSFLGWGILSLLTLGIVGIFYVNPYRNMTNAALYERLRYGADQKLIEAEAEAEYNAIMKDMTEQITALTEGGQF